MPQEVSIVYARNTVRITFRTFTWDDLQASASVIKASLVKIEGTSIVQIPSFKDVVPDGTRFTEVAAGHYELRIDTTNLSPGEYKAVFEGAIGTDLFYEPVPFIVKNLATDLATRR